MYLGFFSGSSTNLRTVGEEESHSFNSTLPIRMFWSVIPQIWNELWNLKVIWNCNYQKCDQQTNSKIARNKKSFPLTISLVDVNYFCKKAPLQIFDRILNITLTTARKVSVFGVFLEFVKIERVERFMGKQISLIFKSLVCCL